MLRVEEISLIDHPEKVVEYNVMVSPAIVINGKVEFTGGVKEKELRGKLNSILQQ